MNAANRNRMARAMTILAAGALVEAYLAAVSPFTAARWLAAISAAVLLLLLGKVLLDELEEWS